MMLKSIKAYADNLKAANKEIFLSWCKENDVVKYLSDDNSWIRILKDIKRADKVNSFKLVDHAGIFEKADGTRIWVFQPYYEREHLKEAGIYEWCEERGLKVVSMSYINSWHFPDETILVQCEVLDEDKCREYIKSHRIGGKNQLSIVE